MAIPSLGALQTALSGLLANQAGLDTAGQNVTNANTPGYSREAVQLSQTIPFTVHSLQAGTQAQIGTGVDITTITRIRDTFLDAQYRSQNSSLGSSTTLQTAFSRVQDSLQEPSANGLSARLSAFWTAWNSLANAPTNAAARQNVIDTANSLTQSFNSLDAQLASFQTQAGAEFGQLTGPSGEVLSDANTLASLNQQIKDLQAQGVTPNALLDQRDSVLDSLSSLAHVSSTLNADGTITVGFGDAALPLVDGTTVTWPQTITSAAGGKLGQLADLADPNGTIGGYRTTLDAVANQLISSVNALQPATPFFSGNSAATIAVSATAATLQTSATAAPGANDLALALAGLRGGATDQSYAALISKVGDDARTNNAAQQAAQALTTAAQNRRQSVSGVSIDEEMTSLMNFQRGYQASARTLTTLDQTLDTLINHTGTVGL